jgi:2-polyprenyl-3-methyl-5-hydroxy-6-metoxy-1,4-benzoquinol methylase
LLHLHLHAGFFNKKKNTNYQASFSASKLQQLYKSLEEAVRFCKPSFVPTVWSDYYEEAFLREDYLKNKKKIVEEWINKIPAKKAVDIGANDGTFSEMLANKDIYTISADNDSLAVNNLYKKIRGTGAEKIHPLVLNLSNPTPAFGLNNEEHMSFIQRTKVDIVLALAVVHHLAIAKNIPFELIASFFSRLGNILIIEFVPKDDPKIKIMLEGRKDVFETYNEENFFKAFCTHYKILNSQAIGSSKRKMFLMELL